MLLAVYLIICVMYKQFLSQNSFKVKPTPIFIVDAKTLTPVNMSQDVFILESLFLLTL